MTILGRYRPVAPLASFTVSMLGELLTHYTIRLALLCFAARWALELLPLNAFRSASVLRGVWSLGCLAFTAHVLCAFHFYHHWNPIEAFEVTAERTEAMLGVRFGEGIYFSYLFWLIWCADVAWLWFAERSYALRGRMVSLLILGYMAFIAFNGAVVFEHRMTRWVGLPISLALLGWSAWNWRTLSRPAVASPSS